MGVKDIAGMGKVVNTVTRAVSNAISALYKPTAILKEGRARADADAYRIEVLAKAKETVALRADLLTEKITQRAKQRFIFEQLQQQRALDEIFAKALKISHRKKTSKGRFVPNDWMYRFVVNGKEITSDEIQDVFARILVQRACKTEDAVSFMTLDALRLFEPRHAKNFSTFSRLYWTFGAVFSKIRIEGLGGGEDEFNELVELGMVDRYAIMEGPRIFRLRDIDLQFEPDAPIFDAGLVLGSFMRLSTRGRELSRIIFPQAEALFEERLNKKIEISEYEKRAAEMLSVELQYRYVKRAFDMIYDYGAITINPRKFGTIFSSRKDFFQLKEGNLKVDWAAAKGSYLPKYLKKLVEELESSQAS